MEILRFRGKGEETCIVNTINVSNAKISNIQKLKKMDGMATVLDIILREWMNRNHAII